MRGFGATYLGTIPGSDLQKGTTMPNQTKASSGARPDRLMGTVNLPTAAAELLESARQSAAGRAGHTLTPGPGVQERR